MTLNVLSLCTGIGAIDLGLQNAGMAIVGQVELDPFCRDVLTARWPEVERHDDVRTALGWWRQRDRPRVDVVAAGSPCQDITPLGRRAGIEGERSGLWADIARLVSELRPRFLLLENSTSLAVRGLDRVLADLARCGFDAEWDCIPAAAIGAPHLRARTWLLAYPRGLRNSPGDTVFAGRPITGLRAGWPPEPQVDRVVDGATARLVRPQVHALGNAVVPQIAEHIGRLIVATDRQEVAA